MLDVSDIISDETISAVRAAVETDHDEFLDTNSTEIIDALIHLSFSSDSKLSAKCAKLLAEFRKNELQAAKEERRQEIFDALASKRYEIFENDEEEILEILLEAASSADDDLRRRARMQLADLPSKSARECLCSHALNNEIAAQISADIGLEPQQEQKRLIFFAATDQWEKFQQLDPLFTKIPEAFQTLEEEQKLRTLNDISAQPARLSAPILLTLALEKSNTEILLKTLKASDNRYFADHFWNHWQKTKNADLKALLIKLGWIANSSTPLRVQSALFVRNLEALDLSTSEYVEELLKELQGNENGLSTDAAEVLGTVKNQDRINQICSNWWQARNDKLQELILNQRWVASEPRKLKLLTLLINKLFDSIENEPAATIDEVMRLLNESPPQIVSQSIKEFLGRLKSQSMIDRVWQIWEESKTPSILQYLTSQKKLAENPSRLRILSRLLIQPESLELTGKGDIDTLLAFAADSTPELAEKARLALSDIKNQNSIDEICARVIAGNNIAKEIAMAKGFAPAETVARANFYVSIGEWKLYKQCDPNFNYICRIYSEMTGSARLDFLRRLHSGEQPELISTLITREQPEQLARRGIEEWELLIPALKLSERWQDIWTCAQLAVPAVSAQLVRLLRIIDWQPKNVDEKKFYDSVAPLLRSCNENGPQPKFTGSSRSINDKSQKVFVHPDGCKIFSIRANGQAYMRSIAGDVTNFPTKFLALSQDGELIAGQTENTSNIALLRASDGNALREFSSKNTTYTEGVFTHDKKRLLLIASNGQVHSLNLETGENLIVYKNLMNHAKKIASSPIYDLMALSFSHRRVLLINPRDGSVTGDLYASSNVIDVAFGSQHVLALSNDGLSTWDLSRFHPDKLFSGQAIERKYDEAVTAVYASGNSYILGTASGQVLRGDLSDKEPEKTIASLGKSILSTSCDKNAHVIAASVGTSLRIVEEAIARVCRLPLSSISNNDRTTIHKYAEDSSISTTDRAWCKFIVKLLDWYSRHDIEIAGGDAAEQEEGLYDIELE